MNPPIVSTIGWHGGLQNTVADTLDANILAAHADGDQLRLVDLYTRAADQAQDTDAEAFFLTYAHVFALELGHPSQPTLKSRLRAMGRE